MSPTPSHARPAQQPRRRPAVRPLVVGLVLLAVVAGVLTAAAAPRSEPATAAAAARSVVPRPDHVVVVVLENKDRGKVVGSAQAPYLNALAARGANMSQSYGVTHPSQGNYVALFSGSQHGVTDDSCPRNLGDVPNLASQLAAAGETFTGYAEALPRAGWTGCSSGRYRRKHNPWVDFGNVPADRNQPLSAFPTDYSRLPTVSFVTPDMCSDMHDCPVATGDAWLKEHLDGYARWAQTHNSLLVVTFDENSGGTVNQIPTLLVGQPVRPGVYAEWMNHYTLLRTIEDAYGLAPLGAAASAAPLRTVWTTSSAQSTGLADGGFERGLAGWSSSGSTASSTQHAHGGSRSARAGRTTATRGDSILSQTLTVPAGRSRLEIWWQGRCADSVGKAWATVVVKRNTSGSTSTLLPRTCVRTGGWHKVGVKVTPGHSYTVLLVNHDDGRKATPNRTYFDDVTLR